MLRTSTVLIDSAKKTRKVFENDATTKALMSKIIVYQSMLLGLLGALGILKLLVALSFVIPRIRQ